MHEILHIIAAAGVSLTHLIGRRADMTFRLKFKPQLQARGSFICLVSILLQAHVSY